VLLEIRHRLHFRYDGFVRESLMELRVEPATTPEQTVQAFHLAAGPPPAVERHLDWHGNAVHQLGIRGYHERIEVEARSVVETAVAHPGLAALDPAPGEPPGELLDFLLDVGPPRRGPRMEALAAEIGPGPDALRAEQVAAIGQLVHERLEYERGVTSWRSSAEEALEVGSGVCQDLAHVMLGLLRGRGIPARYASGYLHLGDDAGPAESHAWVEVLGASGWVAYDPTHTRCTDESYVRVAVGRDYHDVPPNRGVYRGAAEESLEAVVETRRVEPRDVAALRGLAPELDVPVYSELPALARPRTGAPPEQPPLPAEEQQQQ
jgi:transglutaminase-like putative cysteine protease